MAEWYVCRGTEQSGPITQQEFEMLRTHLQRTDLLRRSDWDEWKPFHVAMIAATISTPDAIEIHEGPTPRSLLDALLERDLGARGIAIEKRSQYQYARIIEELMLTALGEIGLHPHWEDALRTRYRQIVSMVEAFMSSCHADFWQSDGTADPRDRLTVLWHHRDLQREVHDAASGNGQLPYLDVEGLSNAAIDYLRRGAKSREFGRLLVDALAAAQICSFAEEINRRASRVALRDWPRLSELAWQKSDGKALAQSRDLLSKMIAAYTALPSVEADPTGCRELLQCVANDGAGWDPLMLKVLEVACHS